MYPARRSSPLDVVALLLLLLLGACFGYMFAMWPRKLDCDKRPNGPYLRSDYAHCD
jgi:hypothetical protein